MTKLYTPQPLSDLLSRSELLFSTNTENTGNTDADLMLLTALSEIENDRNDEPSESLINFLLNYSKSLDVKTIKGVPAFFQIN